MKTPIVLTAFGTTTRAIETYDLIQQRVEKEFCGHAVYRAYSSRMIISRLKAKAVQAPHLAQVLDNLHHQGHPWAVVQSLHLTWGHEFYRLVTEAGRLSIRTSIGLPLLTSHQDHLDLAQGLEDNPGPGQAVVLVGHGTDHPAWTTYLAFEKILRQQRGPDFHVGVVDHQPGIEQTLAQVLQSGAKKVRLIPFMLVAGRHFREDLAAGADSWKSAFEKAGLEVSLVARGLGHNPVVAEIFCHHIRQALEIIPDSPARTDPATN